MVFMTFNWPWFVQDILIFLLAIAVMVFILKKEERPLPILLEFICFVFLYASLYENLATVMGLYGYGFSSIMVVNVPLAVPVIEYLVVYAGIRLGKKMRLPTWMLPFFVGFLGTLLDASLDPLSISQRLVTAEGEIGRWTWFISQGDINLYQAPVYNYTGWFILCGYATVTLLLGRYWQRKAKRPVLVGYLYPPLAMVGALLVMVSPLSSFLLWLGPFVQKGGFTEVLMLCLAGLSFVGVLIYYFIKRNKDDTLTLRQEWPSLVVFLVSHVSDILFTILGGYWTILPWVVGASVLHMGILVAIYLVPKKRPRERSIKVNQVSV